jgi:protein TonB
VTPAVAECGAGDAARRGPLLWSLLAALAVHGVVLFGVRVELRDAVAARHEPFVEVTLIGPPADATRPAPDAAPPAAVPPPPPPRAEPEPTRPARPIRPERKRPPSVALPSAKPEPSASEPQPAASAPSPQGAPRGGAASTRTATYPARGLVTARPRYKSNPEPPYPLEARRRRQQGTVLLSVRVGASGRPESVTLATSSGSAALDAAAIAAVEGWEFDPGRLDGEPIASQVEIPIRFELH